MEAPLFIPPERRTIVVKVCRERGKVMGGIRQFENAGFDPRVSERPISHGEYPF
jgi:hypothetical protein